MVGEVIVPPDRKLDDRTHVSFFLTLCYPLALSVQKTWLGDDYPTYPQAEGSNFRHFLSNIELPLCLFRGHDW